MAVKEMTREEYLAELAAQKEKAKADAAVAPYGILFRAAVEMPDTGGGGSALRLLLGLYNGERFKFDLTDLRRLDFTLHAAAMVAMSEETGSAYYVHERIARETRFPAEAIQAKLEWLANEMGIKGAVPKKSLPEKPGRFVFA
jgi:hypothetical protein